MYLDMGPAAISFCSGPVALPIESVLCQDTTDMQVPASFLSCAGIGECVREGHPSTTTTDKNFTISFL